MTIKNRPATLGLGARLKQAREAKNLTQDELAERALTTQQTISRLELGDRNVSDELVVRLANVLGVSPSWLKFGRAELDDVTDADMELLLKLRRLPEQDREEIEQVVDLKLNRKQ